MILPIEDLILILDFTVRTCSTCTVLVEFFTCFPELFVSLISPYFIISIWLALILVTDAVAPIIRAARKQADHHKSDQSLM